MAVRQGRFATVAVVLVVLLVVLAGLIGALNASGEEGRSAGIPMPIVPAGQGESCVDDPEFLRRYHMTVLQQEHDKAQLTHMPAEKYSLKECVTCHAAKGPDGSIVTADSPQHFCRSCHDYAAVEIECFDCHRSRWRRR
jgi:predicted CXXCH cytochrome family protein